MDETKRKAPVTFGVLVDFVQSVAKETGVIFKEHADRAAALERRLAELEGAHAKTVEAHNSTVTTVNSLERRASRHGEHLGNLETKVRMIERGTAR